jgi:hypothetical protein
MVDRFKKETLRSDRKGRSLLRRILLADGFLQGILEII